MLDSCLANSSYLPKARKMLTLANVKVTFLLLICARQPRVSHFVGVDFNHLPL